MRQLQQIERFLHLFVHRAVNFAAVLFSPHGAERFPILFPAAAEW